VAESQKNGAAGSTLQTVERAVEVLRCFEGGEKTFSLPELTAALGYNKVTVFRLANTLVSEGLLAYDRDKLRYRVSFGLIALGRKLLDLDGLRDSAQAAMQDAREATTETICLSIQERYDQVVVYALPSLQPVRYVLEIGSRGAIFNGAAGQCLLANKSRGELSNMIENDGFSLSTDNSISSLDALVDKVEFIQKNGFCISRGERIAAAAAGAAPIYGPDGTVAAVLSIVMPEMRADESHLNKCAEVAKEAALKISKEYGRSRS